MTDRKLTIWFPLMALAVSIGLVPLDAARAQHIDRTKALKVKAAYVYNFAKFVEWPAGAFEKHESPFVIGILGDDPFGPILDRTVKNKQIAGRNIKIQRFQWHDQEQRNALRTCHVLFISTSEQNHLSDVLAAVKGSPVLMVSDLERFAHRKGMIGFVLENGRIVFEINQQSLSEAGLRASSKLLKLARVVQVRKPGKQNVEITAGRS